MNDLLDTLRNIENTHQFDQLVPEMIESVRGDEHLNRKDKMRLPGILKDQTRSWDERVVLVGNLLIDPNQAEGGFFIHFYTPYVMKSFLTGILNRHGYKKKRQWSFAELDLTESEVAYLRNLPANLVYGYNMPPNAHLGACLLMAEALYLSDDCEDGAVWPLIKKMPWSQNAIDAWFPDYDQQGEGLQKHNDHLRAAIKHYGIRNALDDAGQHWVKTFTLQFGLSKLQWMRLITTSIPREPTHEAAIILFNADDNSDRHSPSFFSTWNAMRNISMRQLSGAAAERLMEESSWIQDEWIPDLINAVGTQRIEKSRLGETDLEEAGSEPDILSEAQLAWVDGSALFKWVVNQAALNLECPEDCKQIELTGPCGWIGRIARMGEGGGWKRIIGLGLRDDLSFQLSADSLKQCEVGFEFSNSNTGFQITSTSHLYQNGDDVTRYGSDGQRQSNAWKKKLPLGEEFSLCVPVGANVAGAQFTESAMSELGMKILCFNQGWTGRIQICIKDQVIWDSENLIAPSKKLSPDLRAFDVYLVIDTIEHASVRGHLKVMGANPEALRIPSDVRSLAELSTRHALSFGGQAGRPLADLWGGTQVRLKIKALDGRNHWISKFWVVTPRGVDNTIPLFLGRQLNGNVISLNGGCPVETMQQFQSMKVKMIARDVVSGAVLMQGGFPIGLIGRTAKNTPKCLGRKIPFDTETFQKNLEPISRGPLMDGVVERGIIESVGDFKNDGSSFVMEISYETEPTRNIQQDSPHHKVLILSQTSQDAGSRLRTTVIEGEAISMEGTDWSKWKIRAGSETGNVLGVAFCYGDTLLGCWTKGGQGAAQNILRATDLTNEEVILLADFLRWFHFPFFDANLKASVYTFLGNHAAAVLFRWETAKKLDWNGVVVSEGIAEPEWDRVVRLLVIESNHFLKAPINYQGLADLIDKNVTDLSEKIDLVYILTTQAPGCAAEVHPMALKIGMKSHFSETVSNDHSEIVTFDNRFAPSIKDQSNPAAREWYWKYRNDPESCRTEFINGLGAHDATLVSSGGALQRNLDPDWSELRREYAEIEKRKGSGEPLIELWRNPSYSVNAALQDGVLQTTGQKLDGLQLQQLNYLMSFSAFSRLLARKILSPNLTIPQP
jgi:hypothetical protein